MKMMDSREVGGTQFLGIKQPVIKCHGNSDPLAFRNGIRQAIQAAQGNFSEELEEALVQLKKLEEAAE